MTLSTDTLGGRLFWRAVSFAVVLGTWEALGRWPVSVAFTPFTETAAAFVRMLADGRFVKAYASTFEPLLIGVAICAVVGIACGIAMGLSRPFEWLTLPVFIILQAAPMAAMIPLITYFYGIGVTAKVLAVVFLSAPVIVMNSYQGIRNTHPALLEMCRSFQGTRRQEIVKIMLPHARGLMFSGLRLGLAMGFIGVVVAELLITPTGIGDLITYHASVADYAEMLAAVVSVVVVAATSITLLERLERALFPGPANRP